MSVIRSSRSSHVRSLPRKRKFQKSQLPARQTKKHLLRFLEKIGVTLNRVSGILNELAIQVSSQFAARLNGSCPTKLPNLVAMIKSVFKRSIAQEIKEFFQRLSSYNCLSKAEERASRFTIEQFVARNS